MIEMSNFANHFAFRRRPEYSEASISQISLTTGVPLRLETIGDQIYSLSEDRIFKIDKTTGVETLYAGTTRGYKDGPISTARFDYPRSLVEVAGDLYVNDGIDTIRRISGDQVTTIIGAAHTYVDIDGPRDVARIVAPKIIRAIGNILYVLQRGDKIRTINLADGEVATVYTELIDIPQMPLVSDFLVYGTDLYMMATYAHVILKLDTLTKKTTVFAGQLSEEGHNDGTRETASFTRPSHLTRIGTDLYVSEFDATHFRKINILTGNVSTIKCNGDLAGDLVHLRDFVGIHNSLYVICGEYDAKFLQVYLPSDALPAIRAFLQSRSKARKSSRKSRKQRKNKSR
jgi:hypothetical protein